ncbi:hypothetical protein ONS95_006644 [Cadophora gregata]|uniref:uncharacterized protein n=1 Tax=Cadophora gregata TaxID=51156 RepID=UPI0026DC84B6|nr:uncharacterized protein ONS95_006644 [Cadophora gregata]KAK0101473.1 hypothetical protein ONS95_006644 [Cadophora gregata]KAK0106519.1 hypothetical protein ONS96_004141 [Cadophora gregata f. sp. sojae]
MSNLIREELYFGAPDLRVQIFRQDGDDVETSNVLETIKEESQPPFSDATAEDPVTPLSFFDVALPIRFRQFEVKIGGLEDPLSHDMRRMDIGDE